MAITFRSAATTTKTFAINNDLTVSKPSGTVDGDLMVAFITGDDGAEMFSAPAGWTEIIEAKNTTGGFTRTKAYYKFASGEGASYTWIGSDYFPMAGIIASYSGVNSSSPVQASAAAGVNLLSTSPIAPSVTTVNANSLLLCAFMTNTMANGTRTMTPPAGMTEVADIGASAAWQPSGSLNELLVVAPGATGTKTATSAVAAAINSISIVLNPALTPAVGTVNVYFPLSAGNPDQGAVVGTGWSASTINNGGTAPTEITAFTPNEGSAGVNMNILTADGVSPIFDRGADVEEGGTESGWTIQLNVVGVIDEDATFEGFFYHSDESDMSDSDLLDSFEGISEIGSFRLTSAAEDTPLKRYIQFEYTIDGGVDPGFVVAPVIVAQKVPAV